MLRVLRSKTLNINSVANLNKNSCGALTTFFPIYLLTFKTVSTGDLVIFFCGDRIVCLYFLYIGINHFRSATFQKVKA
jgi:hypothetical protein